MSAAGPYAVKLVDSDGCELSSTEENTKREAIRCANEKTREACYHEWRVAQVIDAKGVIVWDKHADEKAAQS